MISKVQTAPKVRPLVDARGVLTPEGRAYYEDLERRVPIYGEGSPEGVVSGFKGQSYFDLTGSTGSIHYVKTTDGELTGWILV